MKIKELAEALGMSKNKVNYYIRKNGIRLEKVNGVYQVPDSDIESVKESILQSVKNDSTIDLQSERIGKESPKIDLQSVKSDSKNDSTIGKKALKIDSESVEESVILNNKKDSQNESESRIDSIIESYQKHIETLQAENEYLKQTIAEKDKIIAEKDSRYHELTISLSGALHNAQQLNAMDKLPPENSSKDSGIITEAPAKTESIFSKIFRRR